MSDFLKNFRSAHGRYTGNKRSPYDGHYYPAQDRRTGNERRNEPGQSQQQKSPDSFFSKVDEIVPVLQALLESIADNQQLLFELKERQTKSGELMAAAFSDIARILNTMSGAPVMPAPEPAAETEEKTPIYSAADLNQEEMKSSADEKKEVIKIMKKLRKKGGTYKEIAGFLNEKKIPTFSGKGHWHAQTIHRLCSR